ncbi:MAG: tryptophan--tRNA ligase [bacterium]|nr:tryptophan--tRNA ligase [bacterium]
MKDVILTGLRTNNNLTLGNYLGAILPMVRLQNKYKNSMQINMFIPDLHSFTTPIDHNALYDQSINAVRMFMAAGLDVNDDSTHVYRQSRITGHSELAIILANFTYMGELKRQAQYKEKSSNGENISVGLFAYPVLMAADILLYGAKYVPVGADQTQHVELARDIAIRFNNKFGDIFTLPEPEAKQIEFAGQQERMRIRDLIDPNKKMSKSDQSGKGVVYLSDDPKVAEKKIMGATTDSVGKVHYDAGNQPGISNLLTILAALRGIDIDKVVAEFEGTTNYGDFKQIVADEVAAFLTDFQNKTKSISESDVENALEKSETILEKQVRKLVSEVQVAVGLRK